MQLILLNSILFFFYTDSVYSKKAIFVFNEVKKEEMNKVNGQYNINDYIKRKQKKKNFKNNRKVQCIFYLSIEEKKKD